MGLSKTGEEWKKKGRKKFDWEANWNGVKHELQFKSNCLTFHRQRKKNWQLDHRFRRKRKNSPDAKQKLAKVLTRFENEPLSQKSTKCNFGAIFLWKPNPGSLKNSGKNKKFFLQFSNFRCWGLPAFLSSLIRRGRGRWVRQPTKDAAGLALLRGFP